MWRPLCGRMASWYCGHVLWPVGTVVMYCGHVLCPYTAVMLVLWPCTVAIYCGNVGTVAKYGGHVLWPCTVTMYCGHVLRPCTVVMYYGHVQRQSLCCILNRLRSSLQPHFVLCLPDGMQQATSTVSMFNRTLDCHACICH